MDRITFRPGPLAEPLAVRCQATGERPSDVVRIALARELGQAVPKLDGQVKNLRQYRKRPAKRK